MTSGIARSGEIELSYSVSGQGDTTVLLVMGLGGRAADWGTRFPELLARRHRVVTFDNRGTGASSKPLAHWSLEDMAKDAVSVLDAVGAERAHVIGISMGGMISQLLALDHAARVERLVLMATHFGGPNVVFPSSEVAAVFSRDPGTPVDELMRNSMRLISAPGFADAHPDVIEELVRLAVLQPTPWRAFMAQLQAIIESDRSTRVKNIARTDAGRPRRPRPADPVPQRRGAREEHPELEARHAEGLRPPADVGGRRRARASRGRLLELMLKFS